MGVNYYYNHRKQHVLIIFSTHIYFLYAPTTFLKSCKKNQAKNEKISQENFLKFSREN